MVGANAGYTSLTATSRSSGDAELANWNFIWSENRADLEGDIQEWLVSTEKTPVQKPVEFALKPAYVRLRTDIKASNNTRILQIVTSFSPMKVLLGGKEIYNNQYSNMGSAIQTEYVGNRTNTITIPPVVSTVSLDVYMQVPLAFGFTAQLLSDPTVLSITSNLNYIGFVLAGVLIIAGALLLLMLLVFSTRYNGTFTTMTLALLLIVSGGGQFLYELAHHSSAISYPWLFQLQLLVLLINTACCLFLSTQVVGGYKLPEQITLIGIVAYAVLFMLSDHTLQRYLIFGIPLVVLIATGMGVLRLSGAIEHKKPYAGTLLYSLSVMMFCQFYDAITLFTARQLSVVAMRFWGSLLFIFILLPLLLRTIVYINIRLSEREQQMEEDLSWIQKSIHACIRVYSQQSAEDYCLETVRVIQDLLLHDHQPDLNGDITGLRVCAAMAEGGNLEAMREIYRSNMKEACNYTRIAQRARKAGLIKGGVMFGNHSLDSILYAGDSPLCFIHIEGIEQSLSRHLQTIIRAIHTGLSSMAGMFSRSISQTALQKNVFINLAEIVEQKSSNTAEHLKTVSGMVEVMCRTMGVSAHETEILASASMVHDIGKLAIPDSILTKKGKLTDDEYALMQDHVIYGYNMMSKSSDEFMRAAAIIAQQHHEKYDGSGYLELRGEQIHWYARLVAIVDVFDALLSRRSYKQAWTEDDAVAHINEQSGKHFDPALVAVFNRCRGELIAVKRSVAVSDESKETV